MDSFCLLTPIASHARQPQAQWTLDLPRHPPRAGSAEAGWMLREGKQGRLCLECCGGMLRW